MLSSRRWQPKVKVRSHPAKQIRIALHAEQQAEWHNLRGRQEPSLLRCDGHAIGWILLMKDCGSSSIACVFPYLLAGIKQAGTILQHLTSCIMDVRPLQLCACAHPQGLVCLNTSRDILAKCSSPTRQTRCSPSCQDLSFRHGMLMTLTDAPCVL